MKKLISVLISLTLVSTLVVTAFAMGGNPGKKFSDVDDKQNYKKGIEFLLQQGIVAGYSDGTFKPEKTVNRAEMMKIIVEALVKDDTNEKVALEALAGIKCFNDVAANQWYTKYVCYAKVKGWVKGYDGGKFFRPEKNISVVEAMKIALKAFKIEFQEESDVWFKQMVKNASKKNLIPFTVKAFHADLTRDQMADLIARIIKEKNGELNAYLEEVADVIVTYESIEKGQDLSKLIHEVICIEKKNCPPGKDKMKDKDKDKDDDDDQDDDEDKDEDDDAGEEITITLLAQSNSGESGTATIEEEDGKVEVELKLTGGPANVSQPAHIHMSNCTTIGGVKYSLNNVVNGKSETVIDAKLGDIISLAKTEGLSINVHKSADESSVYYACGNILEKVTPPQPQTHTVNFTASGYSPATLTIKQGDTVKWVNLAGNGTTFTWPASDDHPTHKDYPGTDNAKCGQNEKLFDACNSLGLNATFEFTFNVKGTWNYHDHLNSGLMGIIKVE